MGLDLLLGFVVLMAAIRGWLKGFILQAIRIAGLVACVYVADPVRDLARPYVSPHLPSIRPELVDRLLWWSAAATSYVALVGLATLAHKFSRRPAFGIDEPRRNDQYAGFALGALKGSIVALFLVAGLQKFAVDRVKGIPWAEGQVESSLMLTWSARYQPVARIWESTPVKHFVDHVQRMGLKSPESTAAGSLLPTESRPLQATGGRPARLELPPPPIPPRTFDTSGLDPELAKAVEAIENSLSRHAPPPAN